MGSMLSHKLLLLPTGMLSQGRQSSTSQHLEEQLSTFIRTQLGSAHGLYRCNMRFHQLAQLFYTWGWEVKHENYVAFSDYLKDMLKKDRVFVIYENSIIVAVLLYFLTDDYTKVYKKRTFDTITDNPEGHQIYIDKMICKKWTPSLRHYIKSQILEKFPGVQEGYYHRAPRDRCVKILRRSTYELSNTVS